MKELELYIHIPYCVSKCNYCDFLSAPGSISERQVYVENLCKRICSYGKLMEGYHVVSIFLGGGTPSILEPGQTGKIFETVFDSFSVDADAEITTEMNPGTVTREKLSVYRELGINRLSIGLQSADAEELKRLGRIHTWEEFLATYREAREAGFANINVDLMSAIPGQTLASYERSLRLVTELGPEHISAYSLIIEEGTPFYDRYGEGKHAEELPDEDTERLMYVRTKELLEAEGYHRYEISNYAKIGYECRHNLGYWDRREYLGVGAGASSLIGNIRFREPETLRDAGKVPEDRQEIQILSAREQMEEFMFLGLRKMEGISMRRFQDCFNIDVKKVYGETIKKLCKCELLEMEGDYLKLTERGIDVSNYVMSEFLL